MLYQNRGTGGGKKKNKTNLFHQSCIYIQETSSMGGIRIFIFNHSFDNNKSDEIRRNFPMKGVSHVDLLTNRRMNALLIVILCTIINTRTRHLVRLIVIFRNDQSAISGVLSNVHHASWTTSNTRLTKKERAPARVIKATTSNTPDTPDAT